MTIQFQYILLLCCILYLSKGYSQTIHADSSALVVIDSLNSEDSTATESKYNYVSTELDFIEYLVTNDQYDDALFVLSKLEQTEKPITSAQLDSIRYFRGWLNYFHQSFDIAIEDFKKIDSASPLFDRSVFYQSFCHAYQERYFEAEELLNGFVTDSGTMVHEFKMFQLASLQLLQREYDSYNEYSGGLSKRYYLFSSEEKDLEVYFKQLSEYKKKSPLLAGFLSALFPGMGKFYAGYRGIPFGAMLTTLPLAAIAIESLIIAGLLSPQFLILGGLFAVFYVGNIWGSAVSVIAKRREDYAEIDYNILYNMHVALRRVYE